MRNTRRAIATMSVFAVCLGGCATAEPNPDDDRPSGEPLEVRILDGGFVEFEGGRMTVEEFLYELRLRCRVPSVDELPWVLVESPREERPGVPAIVEAIRREAWEVGIQHLEFELEDA